MFVDELVFLVGMFGGWCYVVVGVDYFCLY